MLQAVVNNSIFSIFWVIWKAKELVFVLAIFVFHRGWYRGDIWQASLWAPRLLLLLRCGKLIKQEKILWVTLDTVNNGNERQSRLQEYADNVLESCLGKISGSNLSEGMTKHDWHYLSRARSVSGRLCHLRYCSCVVLKTILLPLPLLVCEWFFRRKLKAGCLKSTRSSL